MRFIARKMNNYQEYVFNLFSDYRPLPNYPTYPPYHTGLYLEDRFIEDFVKHGGDHDRVFLPISWTTIYCDNKDSGLQKRLDQLDNSKKYFVVCQHDDAPKHRLPSDTVVFSASEQIKNHNPSMIPIPVVCSTLDKVGVEDKIVFAGFVGSYTHPLRIKLHDSLLNNPEYYFSIRNWSPTVPTNKFDEFISVTSRSKFTLCPRGYGNTSFRLYECMQLGSVPVYISDDFHLPWSDELNWDEFCVLINANEAEYTDKILKEISDEEYLAMRSNIEKVYDNYFTLDSLYSNVVRRLK
jgi:hypothetical protein